MDHFPASFASRIGHRLSLRASRADVDEILERLEKQIPTVDKANVEYVIYPYPLES